MSLDIEDILREAEDPAARATSTVTVCLRASLAARYEELDQQLQNLAPASNLAGDDTETAPIAAEMAVVREQMIAHQRSFVLRALADRDFSPLRLKQPQKADYTDDAKFTDAYHMWLCGVVARTCVDPVMTAEQADRLSVALSSADWLRLSNAAWLVSATKKDVPFSVAASVLTRSSGEKSRRPEQPEPPEVGSLAGPPEASPNTSGTTPDT